jgi:tRNA uridine 5-carbamoylmethylation protein Kti12
VLAIRSIEVGLVTMRKRSDYVVNFLVADDSEVDGALVLHEPKNLAASVRHKLFDLARSRNDDFGLILVRYGLEGILDRLSRSTHREMFVLKGALLRRVPVSRIFFLSGAVL